MWITASLLTLRFDRAVPDSDGKFSDPAEVKGRWLDAVRII